MSYICPECKMSMGQRHLPTCSQSGEVNHVSEGGPSRECDQYGPQKVNEDSESKYPPIVNDLLRLGEPTPLMQLAADLIRKLWDSAHERVDYESEEMPDGLKKMFEHLESAGQHLVSGRLMDLWTTKESWKRDCGKLSEELDKANTTIANKNVVKNRIVADNSRLTEEVKTLSNRERVAGTIVEQRDAEICKLHEKVDEIRKVDAAAEEVLKAKVKHLDEIECELRITLKDLEEKVEMVTASKEEAQYNRRKFEEQVKNLTHNGEKMARQLEEDKKTIATQGACMEGLKKALFEEEAKSPRREIAATLLGGFISRPSTGKGREEGAELQQKLVEVAIETTDELLKQLEGS